MLLAAFSRPRATDWRHWRNLLLLSSLSCLLSLADDFLQQGFTPNNRAELEAGYVIALWLSDLPRLAAVSLLGFALLQLGNLSFFGEPLSAIDIRALLGDTAEVRQTLWLNLLAHWPVLLCVGLLHGLLIALHLPLPGRVPLPASRWALLLIAAVLLSKPYRATYRNLDAFVPSPARSGLHNSLNAFSA